MFDWFKRLFGSRDDPSEWLPLPDLYLVLKAAAMEWKFKPPQIPGQPYKEYVRTRQWIDGQLFVYEKWLVYFKQQTRDPHFVLSQQDALSQYERALKELRIMTYQYSTDSISFNDASFERFLDDMDDARDLAVELVQAFAQLRKYKQ